MHNIREEIFNPITRGPDYAHAASASEIKWNQTRESINTQNVGCKL